MTIHFWQDHQVFFFPLSNRYNKYKCYSVHHTCSFLISFIPSPEGALADTGEPHHVTESEETVLKLFRYKLEFYFNLPQCPV